MLTAIAVIQACGSSDDPEDGAVQITDTDVIVRCGDAGACDDGLTCCASRCEDLTVSMRACGACGVACDPVDEYCTGATCASVNFDSLCASAEYRVVHRQQKNNVEGEIDDPTLDNTAANAIATAFAASCGVDAPTPVVVEEASVATPRGPLTTTRGTTVIVAGGRIYSDVVAYLDDVDVTPVELVVHDYDFQLVARAERRVVVQDSLSQLDADHDYLVGQAIYDATGGAFILDIYGIFQPGTQQAVAYFTAQLGDVAFGTTRWFIARYENGTVTLLASG